MKVWFIGVGEAFDEHEVNTSIWVQTGGHGQRHAILLDCGFNVPYAYYRMVPHPMDLDCVWISHFHGDHFLGLPPLLLRFWEDGRERPLTIIGQKGVRSKIEQAVDLAYGNLRKKIAYPLVFMEAEPGMIFNAHGVRWSFAVSGHSASCLAIRLDADWSVFYSGDGKPTPETLALARGADLIVQEAYELEPRLPGHGSVREAVDFARAAGAGQLALVHVQRRVRREHGQEIRETLAAVRELAATMPSAGDVVTSGGDPTEK